MEELRDKAKHFEKTGLTVVYDTDARVAKSDTLVSKELQQSLLEACKPLENVPDRERDWHPGSDGKVLDLVHPSLFPLVYGRSRILPEGKVPLHKCVQYCGQGDVITVPKVDLATSSYWSKDFQWLPCDVQFEGMGEPVIVSYINNLHPHKNGALYPIVEKLIKASIPLWNQVLSIDKGFVRIEPQDVKYNWPNGTERPAEPDEDEEDKWELDEEWEKENRVPIEFEPGNYKKKESEKETELQNTYNQNGLQIIVKLANIHLTPEKPSYDGGSWHVEGQLNERICATSLYYYDCDNITDSYLRFRQQVDAISLMEFAPQGDYEDLAMMYGVEQDGPGIQEVGQVLTREGRLIAFPNVFQHQVAPFKLADPTKPGHRKILALFLVDPNSPIISTGDVPPQQRHWWKDELSSAKKLAGLPQELLDKVVTDVVDFPISIEEAKELREKLMVERGKMDETVNQAVQEEMFSFCEH